MVDAPRGASEAWRCGSGVMVARIPMALPKGGWSAVLVAQSPWYYSYVGLGQSRNVLQCFGCIELDISL
jgi:hypothetical protein